MRFRIAPAGGMDACAARTFHLRPPMVQVGHLDPTESFGPMGKSTTPAGMSSKLLIIKIICCIGHVAKQLLRHLQDGTEDQGPI